MLLKDSALLAIEGAAWHSGTMTLAIQFAWIQFAMDSVVSDDDVSRRSNLTLDARTVAAALDRSWHPEFLATAILL